MSGQSYTYTPNPILNTSTPFNLTFTDTTGTINGLNDYSLEDSNSNVLATFQNIGNYFVPISSGLNRPTGLAFDSSGNLYCANNGNATISKINSSGNIAEIELGSIYPYYLAVDSSGNLYCSDYGSYSISKIDTSGNVTPFVSSGLSGPAGLAFDSSGNLYCANFDDGSISKIDPSGNVTPFVSSGILNRPEGLAFDSLGNLYCGDYNNGSISKIDPSGNVTPFVSSGILNRPEGLAFDSLGNLYCANFGNNTISKIDPSGNVTTFVSSGLIVPLGLAFDSSGNLYCANNIIHNGKISKIATQQLPFTNVSSTNLVNGQNILNIFDSSAVQLNIDPINVQYGFPCFKEGSKILCYDQANETEMYAPVENLRPGDMVKTLKHGSKKIEMIGKTKIYNSGNQERIKERLYRCSQEKYPELTEDLIITGCHSLLVDWLSLEQGTRTMTELGDIYETDGKPRLMAYLDEKAQPYEKEGIFTIYHFALENEHYTGNYGVYANGLLVETCSKRYLKEYSNMELL